MHLNFQDGTLTTLLDGDGNKVTLAVIECDTETGAVKFLPLTTYRQPFYVDDGKPPPIIAVNLQPPLRVFDIHRQEIKNSMLLPPNRSQGCGPCHIAFAGEVTDDDLRDLGRMLDSKD